MRHLLTDVSLKVNDGEFVVLFGPSDPLVWQPRGPSVRCVDARDHGSGKGSVGDIPVETVVACCRDAIAGR